MTAPTAVRVRAVDLEPGDVVLSDVPGLQPRAMIILDAEKARAGAVWVDILDAARTDDPEFLRMRGTRFVFPDDCVVQRLTRAGER